MNKKLKVGLIVIASFLSVLIGVGYYYYTEYLGLINRYVDLRPGMEQSIVFVNVGEKNRGWIANRINEVYAFSPNVLAVDLFFKAYDPQKPEDSLLLNAISNSKAILGTNHNGESIVGVHEEYLAAASDYGFSTLRYTDSFVTHFPVFYRKNQEMQYSFAYQIAKSVDPKSADVYFKSLRGFEQELVLSRLGSQFDIIEVEEPVEESRVRNKVVIFGYVGPSDEDKKTTYARYFMKDFDVTLHQPDTYGPVIVANEVLMILNSQESSRP
jgi:CHASE2 domain-containing sensor protein